MSGRITEWEFTADVASWINEILEKNPELPFIRAKCEMRGSGSKKRRDLTLLARNRTVALTGEIKLPYVLEGSTPYRESVVMDARRKAARAKSPFFFTWNVNELVLWQTFQAETERPERKYRSWTVVNVTRPEHLVHPLTEQKIRRWLPNFLHEYARIYRGEKALGIRPLDDRFIDELESYLQRPIQLALEELVTRYRNVRFKSQLDQWMRDEQGWLISDEPEAVRDNLERAAKFSCYALLNRVVFYEALMKRYGTRLNRLTVPDHINTGDGLANHLGELFAQAETVTGDYETVFGEDFQNIGARIPFYSDDAVDHWRDLTDDIHRFDFSKLDFEVIGRIFERLIAPEERHKYGQHYTRPEVVDLINSFCIHRASDKLMDPACGGGTFLVRAYTRKKQLSPARLHGELLQDLYGVDVSLFATHLTTINLATRDLIDEENYPQVARSDFFDIKPGQSFLKLPAHRTGPNFHTKGMGKTQHRSVDLPPLDAVVGNPPYVRQEEIPRSKKNDKKGKENNTGTKEYYAALVKEEQSFEVPGRSDFHCYFWPHAASFLKEDGRFGFLTSSQWLDVEYGFALQRWLLENFQILAIFESLDEPWFVGARVGTAATLLQKQADYEKRMDNIVRFVQLRHPITEVLAHDGTSAGQIQAADAFRDEILSSREDTLNTRYRVRLVRQSTLWEEGVRLGEILRKTVENEDANDNAHANPGEYYGGKWGVYLRAPDLWFELQQETGERWSPLGDICDVRRGITSGKDCFFFPRDVSAECLAEEPNPRKFKARFGVPASQVKAGKIRLVACGEGRGEIKPIERKFLRPLVRTPLEVNDFVITERKCPSLILWLPHGKEKIKGTHALRYIKWGESRDWHSGSTCRSRGQYRAWYDLTDAPTGPILWPLAHQYRHLVPYNPELVVPNKRYFPCKPRSELDSLVMPAVLNSSLAVLSKHIFGRQVGVEGNLDTEVMDTYMMLVPDPRQATTRQCRRVAEVFEKMKDRKVLQFLSERRLRQMAYRESGREAELENLSDLCELDMADRRELDDAVLEMLGVSSRQRRGELIDKLYDHLRTFYESVRQKEEKAIANKKKAKRQGPAKPSEIAAQIYSEIRECEPQLLRRYDSFLPDDFAYDTYHFPDKGEPEVGSDLFTQEGVHFVAGKRTRSTIATRHEAQSEALVMAWRVGQRGYVRVPVERKECEELAQELRSFLEERETRLSRFVQDRTSDEELQEKILAALHHQLEQRD